MKLDKKLNTEFEIGIDIENVEKFNNLSKTNVFVKNNYTSKEIAYCFLKSNPSIHLAGIFCAKEALIKTLKKRISMLNIEVSHEKNGASIIKISSNMEMKHISNSSTKV